MVEGRLLAFSRGSTDAGSVAAEARKAEDAFCMILGRKALRR